MRAHAGTCGHMRAHAGTCGHMWAHAGTCGHMRASAGSCPPMHECAHVSTKTHWSIRNVILLSIFSRSLPRLYEPFHTHFRSLSLTPAHSRSLPLTLVYSRTCWYTNIYGKTTKTDEIIQFKWSLNMVINFQLPTITICNKNMWSNEMVFIHDEATNAAIYHYLIELFVSQEFAGEPPKQ